jgi:hypothetical protein
MKANSSNQPPKATRYRLPSAAWLAEMAARLRASGHKFIDLHSGGLNYGWVAAAEVALEAHKAAHHVLQREDWARGTTRRIDVQLGRLSKELKPAERKTGFVTFPRFCKLVTGEDRRDRANEKWRELSEHFADTWFWTDKDGEASRDEPRPRYADRKNIPVRAVVIFRAEFDRYQSGAKNLLVTRQPKPRTKRTTAARKRTR